MRGRRLASLVSVVCAAVAATPAAADPVASQPPLKPVFRLNRPDYTVRCVQGQPVRLSLDPPARTRIAVGAGKPRSQPFTASVDLSPGHAVAIRFVRSDGTTVYRVRCLPADFPDWRVKRSGTPQAGWYIVGPDPKLHGDYVPGPGYAVIFDSHGVPVWWYRQTPPVFDADLLPNGHLVWTDFIAHSPFGNGFQERTLDGQVVRTWRTVGTDTNQHDFQPLPNGHVLLVTYPSRDHVDLRDWGGPADATVLDGEVQELDAQGGLVHAWNTKDHIPLAEASRWLPGIIEKPTIHRSDGTPIYDVAHVNSIDPVGDELVFSARYYDAVYAVDRKTDQVLWKLGGTHTSKSLSIVNDPDGSKDFGGQHDARLSDDGRVLTVYDNGSKRHRLPRALEFRLDLAHRRATLTGSVEYPPAGKSVCCGSARHLAGGDWVVSWGNTRWFTEQTQSGDAVLAVEWAADVRSYRAIPVLPGQLSRGALNRAMNAMAP
jgi:hypothetical protein